MKRRSDYKIVQPYGPNDYRVRQRFLWFFWVKPDPDDIVANNFKSLFFKTRESAEAAIQRSISYWNN